jgi:hypothetical protein
MKKILFGIILFSSAVCAQSKYVIKNEVFDLEQIENATGLTYYGIDFSLIKFVYPNEAFNDNFFRDKYLGAWLSYYHREIPPQKCIRIWLKFSDGFIFNSESVQCRIDSVAKDWVVSSQKNEVTIENISVLIKSYNLGEDTGIGFVIHPVEFNYIDKNTICYFTFFDIATKKVLWISETSATNDNYSITRSYGLGMVLSTKNYIDKIYKKTIER